MFYYLVSRVGCSELSRWDGSSPAPAGAGAFNGSGRDCWSGDFRSSRARAHVLQGPCRHAAATGEVIWSVVSQPRLIPIPLSLPIIHVHICIK